MKFLISKAYASGTAAVATAAPAAAGSVPGAGEAFMLNMVLILILVTLFYALLIVPQQRRFRKHREMLSGLKKGDAILTAGGFIGTVDKIIEDKEEVIVDLGNGVKVTALRSTIQSRVDESGKEAA